MSINNMINTLKVKVKGIMDKSLRAKHDRVLIGSLVNVIKEPLPVHVFNTNPKKIKAYILLGGEKISERIILKSLTYQGTSTENKKFYRIQYVIQDDGFTYDKFAYVDETFEIGILKGLQGKILMNKYNENKVVEMRGKLHKNCSRIGSDPEVFVVDEKEQLIPAFTFLKGKKEVGVDMSEIHNGNTSSKPVYWDGFQAEFETSDSYCLAYHTDAVYFGLKAVLKAARRFNPNAKLSIKTVMDIPEFMLNTAAEEHVQLGCLPSLNVYNLHGVPVEDGRLMKTRSTGGHIHFGMGQGNKDTTIPAMIKGLDAVLGVACVALFANYDHPERRKYYGLAGEHRLPNHGFEYRVLSNAWLIHPFIMNLVFDVSRIAATFGQSEFFKEWKATEKETVDCINTCDVKKAQEILTKNKKLFIQILGNAYPGMRDSEPHLKKLFDIFHDGMHTVIESNDIEANWHLSNNQWQLHGEAANKNVQKGTTSLVAETKKLA